VLRGDHEADVAGDVQVIAGIAELGERGTEHGRRAAAYGGLDRIGIEVALHDCRDVGALQRVEAQVHLAYVALRIEVGLGPERECRRRERGEGRAHLGLVGSLGIDVRQADRSARQQRDGILVDLLGGEARAIP